MEPYKKIANLLWETSSSNHASTAKLDIMPKNVNKLLVANRGEIALRVVRTAREMGIPTVAVYAEQDRHAQYVQMADDAYLLSGDTYKDTYLNEDLLIDILQRSGADAVHPGYGFLSEVASFAQKVLDAGATWVGPNPKALVDLGDKITARRVATFAKVPPVPGISQSISDMRLLLAIRTAISPCIPPATAPCSAVTRSWWRKRRRRSFPTACSNSWRLTHAGFSKRSTTSVWALANSW